MIAGRQALRDHDLKKAEAYYSSALRLATPYGEQDPRYAESLHALAQIYSIDGKLDAARRTYSYELRILQRLDVDYSSQGADLYELAKMESGLGHLDAALHFYEQAVIAYGKEPVQFGKEIAACQSGASECYMDKHDYAKAEAMMKQAIAYWQKSTERFPEAYLGVCLVDLGRIYSRQGRYTDAESVFKDDLRNLENLPSCPDKTAGTAACLEEMAENYRLAARYEEAIATFKRAISGWENAQRPPEIARCLVELGQTYESSMQYPDAVLSYKKAISILAPIEKRDPRVTPNLDQYKEMLARVEKVTANKHATSGPGINKSSPTTGP